ncbi:uncharacterized protein BJ171DRAFT_492435 [Polychytrium aggregatum]|uniref:uncharacterized protein n=1 Tax=Polychytrium aggregatum TaxID=110093 RepID=UPI0022FF29FA|nr:uncharacterized protein BJ171DRAFT_492435 [Polychytrium aggregatum]KAI9208036.1 hypothetical protein BJ171DRAFT_492435 [Polychytrium aggregatum]
MPPVIQHVASAKHHSVHSVSSSRPIADPSPGLQPNLQSSRKKRSAQVLSSGLESAVAHLSLAEPTPAWPDRGDHNGHALAPPAAHVPVSSPADSPERGAVPSKESPPHKRYRRDTSPKAAVWVSIPSATNLRLTDSRPETIQEMCSHLDKWMKKLEKCLKDGDCPSAVLFLRALTDGILVQAPLLLPCLSSQVIEEIQDSWDHSTLVYWRNRPLKVSQIKTLRSWVADWMQTPGYHFMQQSGISLFPADLQEWLYRSEAERLDRFNDEFDLTQTSNEIESWMDMDHPALLRDHLRAYPTPPESSFPANQYFDNIQYPLGYDSCSDGDLSSGSGSWSFDRNAFSGSFCLSGSNDSLNSPSAAAEHCTDSSVSQSSRSFSQDSDRTLINNDGDGYSGNNADTEINSLCSKWSLLSISEPPSADALFPSHTHCPGSLEFRNVLRKAIHKLELSFPIVDVGATSTTNTLSGTGQDFVSDPLIASFTLTVSNSSIRTQASFHDCFHSLSGFSSGSFGDDDKRLPSYRARRWQDIWRYLDTPRSALASGSLQQARTTKNRPDAGSILHDPKSGQDWVVYELDVSFIADGKAMVNGWLKRLELLAR